MTFKVQDQIQARLDELGATYTVAAQARATDNARAFKCELQDKATGIVFAEGYGPTKEASLTHAVEGARIEDKPMTPAELVTENARLRRELEAKTNPTITNRKAKA